LSPKFGHQTLPIKAVSHSFGCRFSLYLIEAIEECVLIQIQNLSVQIHMVQNRRLMKQGLLQLLPWPSESDAEFIATLAAP